MDGVVFRKDGIEFQLNDFEFSFDANGNFVARHTGTGNELTFTTNGNLQIDSITATDIVGDVVDATNVTSETVNATVEITSPSMVADSLEGATIVDGAGVSHSSELADKSDVTEVGFPYDINNLQDVPDSHSVIVEGPVDTIDGTLDDRNALVKIE